MNPPSGFTTTVPLAGAVTNAASQHWADGFGSVSLQPSSRLADGSVMGVPSAAVYDWFMAVTVPDTPVV